MPVIKTGVKSPNFKLLNQDGVEKSLKDLLMDSSYLVLYFYPKDLTPGCTLEAQEFTKHIKAFQKLNVSVAGVSGGSADSKKKFCDKHNLKITLLADEDFSVSKKFGAYGEKKFMGKTYNGILRKTFVINSQGKISHIYADVKAEGHALEVKTFLTGIGKKIEKGRSVGILQTTARTQRNKKANSVSKASRSKGKIAR
jgi:peroxiredoxin Q/BCP